VSGHENQSLSVTNPAGIRRCCKRTGRARLFLVSARLIVAFLSWSVLPVAGATIASMDPAVHYKIAHIAITGEREFPESDLLAVMATKTRSPLSVLEAATRS